MGVTQVATDTASKISTNGKMLGGFLYLKAKQTQSAVNSKIDENEQLHSAKEATKEKLSYFGGMVSSGWNSLYSKINPQ